MSAHLSPSDLPKGGERIDPAKIGSVRMLSLAVGVGCLLILFYFLFFQNEDGLGEKRGDQASYSYLFAILFFWTLAMGGLFWTILHHATNSGWGIVVRRQMENIAGLVPVMFLLMIPFW
ncbi:MAG: hypothetical protein AAF191_17835, partial [Verrucomicrobiota bacterium]